MWIYRYVTEGSFDAYMWRTSRWKATFIAQLLNGKISVRKADDISMVPLSYAENSKALASGNPEVMEKVKVDTEIRNSIPCNQPFLYQSVPNTRRHPGRKERHRLCHGAGREIRGGHRNARRQQGRRF